MSENAPAPFRFFWPLQAASLLAMLALGVAPEADRLTWFLENLPVMLVVPILVLTRRALPLTPLVYALVFLHGLIVMTGGHYTYAEVPLGHWAKDAFGLARNHYDRAAHLLGGAFYALAARELLLRATPLRPGAMLFFLVACICLAFSALYELVEWLAAVLFGEGALAFLGTQGDVWDSQWDMLLALLGALGAQLLLARLHDRQLRAAGVLDGGGRPAGKPRP